MRQPDPKPGATPVAPSVLAGLEAVARQHVDYVEVWPWLKVRLENRIEEGRRKYGALLETMNGRDALVDAWQEAADLVQYLTQVELEANGPEAKTRAIFLLADARALLLKLSRVLWEREQPETLLHARAREIAREWQSETDCWEGWQGGSEPE